MRPAPGTRAARASRAQLESPDPARRGLRQPGDEVDSARALNGGPPSPLLPPDTGRTMGLSRRAPRSRNEVFIGPRPGTAKASNRSWNQRFWNQPDGLSSRRTWSPGEDWSRGRELNPRPTDYELSLPRTQGTQSDLRVGKVSNAAWLNVFLDTPGTGSSGSRVVASDRLQIPNGIW